MRALLLSLFILVFLSCSEEEQEKINSLNVSPPSWIQGTWTPKNETSNNPILRFTNDAFIKIDENGFEYNIMTFFLLVSLNGEDVTINEINNSTSYSIYIKTEVSGDSSYEFTKVSDQEMSWDNAPPTNSSELYVREQ